MKVRTWKYIRTDVAFHAVVALVVWPVLDKLTKGDEFSWSYTLTGISCYLVAVFLWHVWRRSRELKAAKLA